MSDIDNTDVVAEAMYDLVRACHGKRQLKATDLTKEMTVRFGAEVVTRETGKAAIRRLIDSGRCVYSYAGGSFIVLSPEP